VCVVCVHCIIGSGAGGGPGGPWPPHFLAKSCRSSRSRYSNRTVIHYDIVVKSFLYSYSFLGGSVVGIDSCGRARRMAVTFFFFFFALQLNLK